MKKWIAICMAICLLLSAMAMAETDAATDAPAPAGTKLPGPEEVAELESDAVEPAKAQESEATDALEETAPATEDTAEAEPTDTPETEPAEAPEIFEVWFEEGFSLSVPEGWVSYAVSEEDRADGVRYALGDGSGKRLLYILIEPSRMADIETLSEAVENAEGLTRTGELTFGGVDFVAFIDARQNASCCATLIGGDRVVFMFTPQTDSDYMLAASRLMETFNKL